MKSRLTKYSDFTILVTLMADDLPFKPVVWVGSSRKDLREFPDPVQDHVGYALYVAQRGGRHRDAKPLSGFGGAGFHGGHAWPGSVVSQKKCNGEKAIPGRRSGLAHATRVLNGPRARIVD